MKSERGQGLLETLLGLPIAMLVASALIALLYRSIVFHIGDYQAHEALICTQSESSQYCKKEIEARLKTVLITKPRYNIEIHHGWRSTSIRIDIEMSPPLRIEKSLPRI